MQLAENGIHEDVLRVMYQQGMYGVKEDKVKGIKWHRRGVEAGSGKSADNLGLAYLSSVDGAEKDAHMAVEYFRKAVEELNDAVAYTALLIFACHWDKLKGVLFHRQAAICGVTAVTYQLNFDNLRNAFNEGSYITPKRSMHLRSGQTRLLATR